MKTKDVRTPVPVWPSPQNPDDDDEDDEDDDDDDDDDDDRRGLPNSQLVLMLRPLVISCLAADWMPQGIL